MNTTDVLDNKIHPWILRVYNMHCMVKNTLKLTNNEYWRNKYTSWSAMSLYYRLLGNVSMCVFLSLNVCECLCVRV